VDPFALLNPDPDPDSGSGSNDLIESGSETLVCTVLDMDCNRISRRDGCESAYLLIIDPEQYCEFGSFRGKTDPFL